jgi:hypothetical protein
VATGDGVAPDAISDDGTVMASIHGDETGQTVDLVGLSPRTYRKVLSATSVGGLDMTPDGHTVAIAASGVSTTPGGDGLFVFNRTTGTLTFPNQPVAPIVGGPSVSADGRWVALLETGITAPLDNDIVLVDVQSGTSQVLTAVGDDIGAPQISSDGSTVAWGPTSADGTDPVTSYDRASGVSTTVASTGIDPVVSGNGGRVAFIVPGDVDSPDSIGVWDRAVDTTAQLGTSDNIDVTALRISTDGTRLIAQQNDHDLGLSDASVADWTIFTDTFTVVAGPVSLLQAASADATHVIYLTLGSSPTTFSAWTRP